MRRRRCAESKQQPRPALRIAERDGHAVMDLDHRYPGTIDEDPTATSVYGRPMWTDEAQQHIGLRNRRGWGGETEAVQRDVAPVAVRHDDVATWGEHVPRCTDEDGEWGGWVRGSHLVSVYRRRLFPHQGCGPVTTCCGARWPRHCPAAGATPAPPRPAPADRRARALPTGVRWRRRGRRAPRSGCVDLRA